jgi:hypothetical protein
MKFRFPLLLSLAAQVFLPAQAQPPAYQFVIPIQGAGGGGPGNANYDETRGIAADAAGNIYAAGFFTGEADFDPSTGQAFRNTLSGQDPFLVKYSPSGTYQWVAHIKGGQNDRANGLIVDSAGNSYVVGWFSVTSDFDPSPATFNLTAVGNNDIFLAKYSPQGALVWAHNVGGSLSDYGNAIAFTASGDIAITGHFQGSADFDPSPAIFTLSSAGNKDAFLAIYSPGGTFLSAISVGGSLEDDGLSLAADANGGLFLGGFFNGTADFDPGAGTQNRSSAGLADLFLARYIGGTTLDWVGSAGSTGSDKGLGLAVAANGDVVLTGSFSSTLDLDFGSGSASHTSAGLTDGFMARYTNAGSHLWSQHFGSTFDDAGQALSFTSSGDVGLTGYFRGTVDFDPGAGSAAETSDQRDLFVGTYSPSGGFQWVFHVGGSVDDEGLCLDFDNQDNLILGGYYWSNTDFDPSPGNGTIAGSFVHEGFVAKYGNPCLTATAPVLSPNLVLCEGDSATLSVAGGSLQSATGWVWYQGSCGGTLDGNGDSLTTGSLAPGAYSWFVRGEGGCAGNGPCATVQVQVLANALGSEVASICQGESYAFGSQVLTAGGFYTETFPAASGCDSIVSLTLSVLPDAASSISASICQGDSYPFGNQTLSAAGIYTETFAAANGCDSVVSLTLSVLPNAASSISASICQGESYPFGNQTLSAAGIYTETFAAANGCDSVVSLTLRVLQAPEAAVFSAISSPPLLAQDIASTDSSYSYQWLDCDTGFSPIPGETDSTFFPQVSGSYAVLMTGAGGCADTSACLSFTVGIAPDVSGPALLLSPNPVQDVLEVSAEFPAPSPATLSLYDLHGRRWLQTTFSAAPAWQARLDLSALPSGVYVLILRDAQGQRAAQVLKP